MLKCPNCQRTDRIDIQYTAWARLEQEGDENVQTNPFAAVDQSHDWNDDSPFICAACGYNGKVIELDKENQ